MSKVKVAKNIKLSVNVSKVENDRIFLTEGKNYPFPDLLEVQKRSYEDFISNWIADLIDEINPIVDFSWKKIELYVLDHKIEKPKYSAKIARKKNLSYESLITSHVRLVNKETWEIKEQDIFLWTIPLMTSNGTFIVNGIERVVVNQLVRSPWAFFSKSQSAPWKFNVKIIPKRWAWLEIETDKKWILYAKIDRKRKFPVSQMLRLVGFETDKKIIDEFATKWLWVESDCMYVTLDKDPAKTPWEACQSIYRKIRPWDLATMENAKLFIEQMFFDYSKYDMWPIARYKLNKRFNLDRKSTKKDLVFQAEDFVLIIKELLRLNHEWWEWDDIDHLENRRIRSVGELVANKFRIWLMRMERIIKDRMTIIESEQLTPIQLINSRPVTAALREFFVWSQLSQFMDQTNPLAELAHKRRLSAMWPWWLSRERASFEVRDVHTSHYWRICPIATPEWPNIWLVLHLASYAKVNEYWFIETPFRKIAHSVKHWKEAIGRILSEWVDWLKKSTVITESNLKSIKAKDIAVKPYLTNDISYYDAWNEKGLIIAQANTEIDEKWNYTAEHTWARINWKPTFIETKNCTHIDVSPKQIVSEFTALIPFLEHDDNTRASMGANMVRQSVSLVRPEAPLVWTWLESMIADATGQKLTAKDKWKVIYADWRKVEVIYKNWEKVEYELDNYIKSNQWTVLHSRCAVRTDQTIEKWDVLANWASVESWELAIWQNLLVAYMTWRWYNFEDAIIISDRAITWNLFDSVHIKEYIADIRDTKLWPEQTTRDIPNVWEGKLKNLDKEWIIRVWASVKEGDILAWKITPKWETEQSPEERLLQAIFWEKAKDIKDTSLRLWWWEWWKVIDIQVYDRSKWDELAVWVIKQVRVYVAQTRKLQVWDKMAWRHWNKWVVAKIVPREDMPYLEDWTPVDIILNPLWVASRMNVGQIFETHLWLAAKALWIKIATPALNWIKPDQITSIMKDAWTKDKVQLYDWRTWEPFTYNTTVWVKYLLKLWHLVEDKIHARSVWPYSLVTQQPLWWKAQHGWQRFWEMEVWALEWYWAAHTLQEMLTIKSDDVMWRARAYEDIVKWQKIRKPSIPESFSVLVHELRWLCLNIDLIKMESQWESILLNIKSIEKSQDFEEILPRDEIEELHTNEVESDEKIEEELVTEWDWISAEQEMDEARENLED